MGRVLQAQIVLATLGALVLSACLPVGMFLGTASSWIDYLFALHLGLHSAAVVCAVAVVAILVHRSPWGVLLPAAAMLAAVCVVTLLAWPPVTARDALVHHLAVPKLWLELGEIKELPWHEWSYYPMLIDLAYLALLKLNLVSLSPFYHATYLILLAGLVGAVLRNRTKHDDVALFGVILTLTLPICLRLASVPLVDLALAYYCAAAFTLLVLWTDRPAGISAILLAGANMGLALSTKYNALPAVALLLILIPFLRHERRPSFTQILGCLVAGGSVALVVFGPWLLKNTIWTLNPLFPLMKGFFGSASELPSLLPGLKPLAQRHALYGESWWEISALPLRMMLFGQDDNPRRFDGVLSPLLLLAIFALFRRRKEPWLRFGIAVTATYFICALILASARVRYLAPILGPLIMLSADGALLCAELFAAQYRRAILGGLISIHLIFSALYSHQLLRDSAALNYITGQLSSEQYLQRFVPEYGLIQYANHKLDQNSCIYLLYVGNHFYLHERCVRGSYNSANLPIYLTRTSQDAQAIAGQFLSRGIDHLMAHIERTRRVLDQHLTKEEHTRWNTFATQHLVQLQTHGALALYRISPSAIGPTALSPADASE